MPYMTPKFTILARARSAGSSSPSGTPKMRRAVLACTSSPLSERLDQRRVLREVRHHAQLDLRVVGAHQQGARGRDEGPPDGAALRRAEGDVLQVGVARGEPPGGRHRLVEGGVHAPVGRPPTGGSATAGQRVEVGGLELGQRPVLEQELRERVLRGQFLEHALSRSRDSQYHA